MAKTIENESSSINLLGSGTKIIGEIISNGDFRIDGTLQGNIKLKGKLVLGQTGRIEGNIVCQNADFSGTVCGNVKVYELLSLQKTSKIDGDINIGKLSIEPGAVFSGKCFMGEAENSIEQTKVKEVNQENGLDLKLEMPLPKPTEEQKKKEQQGHAEKQAKFMFHKNEKKR